MKEKVDFVRSLLAKDVEYPQLALIADLKAKFGQGLAFPAVSRIRDAYKNGKFDQVATEIFADMEKRKAQVQSSVVEKKRGPGRPRKDEKVAAKPAPSKAAKVIKAAKLGRPAAAPEAPAKAAAPAAAPAAPVKRGRGRPRKHPVIVPPAATPEAAGTLPPKRGPGRPRKHPPKPVLLDENGMPIKRGRGRPRKYPLREPAIAAALDNVKRGPGRPPKSASASTAAPVAPAPVKERGDRRTKGVAVVRGRRKADKLLVQFDSVPNHLVLAFQDGGVQDFRFKAKDDAKKCIQDLMSEGLAASRIAYYNRQDFSLEVSVKL